MHPIAYMGFIFLPTLEGFVRSLTTLSDHFHLHFPSSLHSTLSTFIKHKALLTRANFHIVFPLHTANNKHKKIF